MSRNLVSRMMMTHCLTVAAAETSVLNPGPHLFLDDHLIERSTGVERKVLSPPRFLDGPIVTGQPQHQNYQSFLTVLHDPIAARALGIHAEKRRALRL
jgi:hypothetical protein